MCACECKVDGRIAVFIFDKRDSVRLIKEVWGAFIDSFFGRLEEPLENFDHVFRVLRWLVVAELVHYGLGLGEDAEQQLQLTSSLNHVDIEAIFMDNSLGHAPVKNREAELGDEDGVVLAPVKIVHGVDFVVIIDTTEIGHLFFAYVILVVLLVQCLRLIVLSLSDQPVNRLAFKWRNALQDVVRVVVKQIVVVYLHIADQNHMPVLRRFIACVFLRLDLKQAVKFVLRDDLNDIFFGALVEADVLADLGDALLLFDLGERDIEVDHVRLNPVEGYLIIRVHDHQLIWVEVEVEVVREIMRKQRMDSRIALQQGWEPF